MRDCDSLGPGSVPGSHPMPEVGDGRPVDCKSTALAHPPSDSGLWLACFRLASAVGRLPRPRLDVNGQFGMMGVAVAVQDS
jgi:hypothetical protein